MQAIVPEPPENASSTVRSKNKKGDIKAKKILIDALKDHFLIISLENCRSPKKYDDKLVGMYEVNMNHILSLKNQQGHKDEKGEICAILCHEDISTKGSIVDC